MYVCMYVCMYTIVDHYFYDIFVRGLSQKNEMVTYFDMDVLNIYRNVVGMDSGRVATGELPRGQYGTETAV